MPKKGFTSSTGKSLPSARRAPESSTVRQAYAPLIRSGPTRSSAHGMSLVACVGCIDAITLEQRSATAAEGAVGVELHRAHREATAVVDQRLPCEPDSLEAVLVAE